MTKMFTKLSRIARWFSVLVIVAAAPWVGPRPMLRSLAAAAGKVNCRSARSVPGLGRRCLGCLAWKGPRTYLVLVQNSHELRATGGFIAAVGRVSVDGGRLVDFDFQDSYALYSDRSTYPPAPQAMQQYMGIPLLVMRDANWSPDFPTTAQVARALYMLKRPARRSTAYLPLTSAPSSILSARSGH